MKVMLPLRASNVGRGNGAGDEGMQAGEAVCAKAQRADGAPWVQGSRKSWVWMCGWGPEVENGVGRGGISYLTW